MVLQEGLEMAGVLLLLSGLLRGECLKEDDQMQAFLVILLWAFLVVVGWDSWLIPLHW